MIRRVVVVGLVALAAAGPAGAYPVVGDSLNRAPLVAVDPAAPSALLPVVPPDPHVLPPRIPPVPPYQPPMPGCTPTGCH
jgi:hypothetical protein